MSDDHYFVRLRHVKRWGIVNTATTQSVAEHSGLVAILALHIATRGGLNLCADSRALLLEWALWHDMPEVFTGDIPSSAKDDIGRQAIELAEIAACSDYSEIMARLDGHPNGTAIRAMVKIADLVEATLYLETDGLGIHAGLVKASLYDKAVVAAADFDHRQVGASPTNVRAAVAAVLDSAGSYGYEWPREQQSV